MHYHLLLGELDLTARYNISAAGAFGAQDWTPAFDAETIVYGAPKQQMPSAINKTLNTGALSPAVLVHVMLKELAKTQPVHIHVHNLGLRHAPDLEEITAPWAQVTYHEYWLDRSELDEYIVFRKFQVPQALERAAELLQWMIRGQLEKGQDVIIAECVPGGTTTAEVWWSLYTDDQAPTPSSSTEQDVISNKHHVVNAIRKDIAEPSIWMPGDNFQHVLARTLRDLPVHETEARLYLGGGSQMGAVLQAAKAETDHWPWLQKNEKWQWWTTPWIAKGWPPAAVIDRLPCELHALDFKVEHVVHPGLALYDQGYVKEGLGLGAVLSVLSNYMQLEAQDTAELLDKLCCIHEGIDYDRSDFSLSGESISHPEE